MSNDSAHTPPPRMPESEFNELLEESKKLSLELARRYNAGAKATYIALLAAASLSCASGCDAEKTKESFADALASFARILGRRMS